MQQTYIIGPLKNNPRCITYIRDSEQQDTSRRQHTSSTDEVLIGDDLGYVTLLTVDVRDLTQPPSADADAGSGSEQDRRIVYVDPKHLTASALSTKSNMLRHRYTLRQEGQMSPTNRPTHVHADVVLSKAALW